MVSTLIDGKELTTGMWRWLMRWSRSDGIRMNQHPDTGQSAAPHLD